MLPQMNRVVTDLTGVITQMAQTAAILGDGAIEQVKVSVTAMVQAINDISSSIKSLGNVNLNSELRNLSSRLGLGNTTRLQIQKGDLTLNVRVNVILKVDEIEEALTTRPGGSRFLLNESNPANRGNR